jgi:hypothetical protein
MGLRYSGVRIVAIGRVFQNAFAGAIGSLSASHLATANTRLAVSCDFGQ